MCAILDSNTSHEVFGNNQSEASLAFFNWIVQEGGHLVIGGKNEDELTHNSPGFRHWKQELQRSGRMTIEDKVKVNSKTDELISNNLCISDDEHVVALALVSGARLLYSNDGDLQQDFNDHRLIRNPRGKVYTTNVNIRFDQAKRRLLRSDLCRPR